MQIKKVKPKMGFIYLAKHGLNKHGLKTKNWSHLVRDQTVEREREEEKREEEEEEERRRRGEEGEAKQAKVWNLDFGMELTLDMNSIMDLVWNSRKDYEFQT